MIILWDLPSMSEVKEYFVLIYSIGLPFISLILNALLQWRVLIFSHGLLNPCPEMYDPFTSHHDKHLSTAAVNASYFMAWFTIHCSLSWTSLAFSFHLCLCTSQLDVHSFGFLELFFLSGTTVYNGDAKTKEAVFKNDTH